MSVMRLIRPPGVYAPQADSELLVDCLAREEVGPGVKALDLCTGTGVVAIAAARVGAEVTAIDISRTAVTATRFNARFHGTRIRIRRGDLAAPVAGERFDLVTVNPPYVPSASPRAPARGRGRSWDAGRDGRLLLDRICRVIPAILAPHGVLLIVQSSLAGVGASLGALSREGLLSARVVARRREPFGPVMTARAGWFEEKGLVAPGTRSEELVVIRTVRAGAAGAWAGTASRSAAQRAGG